MKVLKPGVLPENRPLVGSCPNCGCRVEVAAKEATDGAVACPTEGCGKTIRVVTEPVRIPFVGWGPVTWGA